jgi:DsrE/DsrF-like family
VADQRGGAARDRGLRRSDPGGPGSTGEARARPFIEKGGRFYVCPICFGERDLDEDDLVANAELKGATPLMEFAGNGATAFNY